MQTILRPSPIGPSKRDVVSIVLLAPYFGGVVAAVFGIQGIGGLAMLGIGLATTMISGWFILLRDNRV